MRKKTVENNPKNACGLDFICQGKKMKVKKTRKAFVKTNVPIKELTFD